MAKKKVEKPEVKINLAEMTILQLKEEEKKTRNEWVKVKMDLKVGKLKDVHQPKKLRKQIAKIKTLIKEKEMGGI